MPLQGDHEIDQPVFVGETGRSIPVHQYDPNVPVFVSLVMDSCGSRRKISRHTLFGLFGFNVLLLGVVADPIYR